MENKKLYSILAYIIPLWIVGLISAPNDPDVKFHVNQGIILTIAAVIVSILGTVIPFIGWFLILPLGSIAILVLAIMGIINANNGQQKELAIIGKFRILK
jgi:uncharacterized membrane protein